jgi:hypothetical protein
MSKIGFLRDSECLPGTGTGSVVMVAEIYGLFSGRDGRVRYVGMTAGDRHDRFKEHRAAAELASRAFCR